MIGRFIAIVVLLLLNGYFVAVEFSLVRSRRTRLEAMARAGDAQARLVLRATSNLNRMLSASQLGITLSSLGLGWEAERSLGEIFGSFFERLPIALDVSVRVSLGAAVAMILVTYCHVVFGELAPRAVALNHPERVARWLAPPLLMFAWVTTPFINLLNKSSQVVLRTFGQPGHLLEEPVHSPEELRLLVEQSEERGALQSQDADLIEGVFEFSEKNAREVMTPRTEIIAIPLDADLQETMTIVEDGGFSRFPVYEDSIDDVVGIVLAKDLLPVVRRRFADGPGASASDEFHLRDIIRPVHVVPGSREVEDVLADFKRLKEHMAIVLDEYGGTAGVVTMEDLLEEIVGEILDEYDDPAPVAAVAGPGELLVSGGSHIGELNDRFTLSVPHEEYTTIGGYVFGALGRLPTIGDRVAAGGAMFTVRTMAGRRIESLAMELHVPPDRRSTARDATAEQPSAAGD